jgi:hypothetical protein
LLSCEARLDNHREGEGQKSLRLDRAEVLPAINENRAGHILRTRRGGSIDHEVCFA